MKLHKTLKSYMENKQYLPGIDTEDSEGRYPTESKFLKADHEQILRWYKFLPEPKDPEQKKIKDMITSRIMNGDKAGKLNSVIDSRFPVVTSPNTNESKKNKK